MKRLIVSPSPHDENYLKTSNIMLNVCIALVPALIAACVFFGFRALLLTAVCVGCCVLFEFLCRKIMKRDNTISDLSAVVTGIILALNLPVTLPLWMAAIGSFIAIVIVKQLFGGLGQNFANPAITARIVLMVSFPTAMTHWVVPFFWREAAADAVTSATPLALGEGAELPLISIFSWKRRRLHGRNLRACTSSWRTLSRCKKNNQPCRTNFFHRRSRPSVVYFR